MKSLPINYINTEIPGFFHKGRFVSFADEVMVAPKVGNFHKIAFYEYGYLWEAVWEDWSNYLHIYCVTNNTARIYPDEIILNIEEQFKLNFSDIKHVAWTARKHVDDRYMYNIDFEFYEK